jgi:phage internal scaffolding protein
MGKIKDGGDVVVRSAFDFVVSPGLDFSKSKSLTDQSQKDSCDVNRIVDSFMKSGVLPQFVGNPMYGDFDDQPSYQEACNIVNVATQQFMGLDAKVRARFGNDPGQFLAFCTDASNIDEMVKLGLATRREVKEPISDSSAANKGSTPTADPSSASPADKVKK